MVELLLDTLLDGAKVTPFLLLTYLIMEYFSHKMGRRTEKIVLGTGPWGPVVGATAGAIPQCGFSAAAASLYAGRLMSLGTLLAIFLSTSDEMLPILLSARAPAATILKILGLKMLIGAVIGFGIDAVCRRMGKFTLKEKPLVNCCDADRCSCEKRGIVMPALLHTAQVLAFLLVISFGLNLILYWIGADALGALILSHRVLGVFLAGIVGLIPNCAASVVLTSLYLEGLIGFGAVMSGLLVGAGVGLLVLFRQNRRHMKENLIIVGLLFTSGVVCGLIIEGLSLAL